jgi:hypothetical protein
MHGIGPKDKPSKTNFHLGVNPETFKEELESFGFTNIKIWYQPMYFPFESFEDYWELLFMRPPAKGYIEP